MNLFVAIEPSIGAVEQLIVAQEDLADPLRQLGADAGWTSAEQMRLILRVCPHIERGDLSRVRETIRSVARNTASPALAIEGLSFAPAIEHPRMIVAGVVGDGLEELQRRIDGAIEAAGLPVEERPWRPWVLVGRLRGGSEPLRLEGVLGRFGATRFGSFVPRELVLVTSRLDGSTPRQSIEDRIAFGTGR